MTQDSLKCAIAAAQQRLETLLQRADGKGENSGELLQEAIAELSNSLEELQVVAEELEAQNRQLMAACDAVEADRQLYQNLFNAASDGYLLTDAAGIIQQANPAAAPLLNTQQSYLLGKPLAVFVHPQQRRKFRQILTQLQQQEQIRGEELWMFHPARKIDFPAQLTGVAMRDNQGKLQSLCFLVRDISDRKQAQEKLAQSESLLRTIIESEPECVKLVARDGTLLDMNPAGLAMIEVESLAQVQGKSIYPVVVSDYRQEFQALTERVFQGESGILEFEIVGLKGTRRWLETHAVPLRNPNGEIAAVLSVTRDISDRQHLELALQTSETKLKDILNRAIASIVSFRVFGDETWQYDYYSVGCEAIFGFTPEEMMTGIWWSRIPPEDQQSIVIPARQFIFAEQPTRIEYRFLHKDGTLRWISTDLSSRYDEANRCFRVIAVDSDISDRKRAETALAASEQKLRGVLNTAGAAIAHFRVYANRNWEYEFYSAGTLQLFGYTPEEMVANKTLWSDRIHPEDFQNVILPAFENIFAHKTVTIEFRYQRRDGKWIWVADTLTSNRNESLDCWLVTCIEVDISARKQAESELAKINTAMLHAVEGISRLDTQGRYITVNQAYANTLGYTPAEMIGMSWYPTVHPDDLETAIAAYQEMLSTGKGEAEARGIRQDGSMFYKQVVMVAAYEDKKQLIGHYCFMKNISDRKIAEIQLQRQAQQKELLNRVIQGIRNSLDLNVIFQTATSEFAQLLSAEESYITQYFPEQQIWRVVAGYRQNPEMPDKTGLEIPDTENPVTAKLKKLEIFQVSDAKTLEDELNRELAQICPGSWLIIPLTVGESLWGSLNLLHSQANTIWYQDQIELARAVADQLAIAIQQANLYQQLQQELIEHKQTEIELQKAKEAAEAANVAKSTFLANMSHELRTPLNAILGFTQMMARDRTLSPQQQEKVKIINNAGDHLLALINDILEMSKIEAGRTSFNPTSFDLINFLSTLEELFKLKAESKGLQLNFHQAPDLPQYIQTDEGKLRQVLINIIGNAIKFTEKGEVTIRVTQGTEEKITNSQLPISNHQLIFEIQDTGFGINPEEIDRIFDPFTQSEAGKKTIQGTGLGLAISRKFVQMMGGNIRVNSQPNKGSLFTFDIQVTPAETIDKNPIQTPRQIIGLAPNQPEYRILIVDDHPESRLLLVTLLGAIGFQVKQAANGSEAISIWSTWKPHLICMDIRMPVMNGIEATQQIRATENELFKEGETRRRGDAEKVLPSFPNSAWEPHLPSLPGSAWEPHSPTIIIALTANAFDLDKNLILAAGCDDYISKPLKQELVLSKIGEYLEIAYIYESDNQQPEENQQDPDSKLPILEIKKYLNQMPVEWIKNLHKTAYICDESRIFELLAQIPPEYVALTKAIADFTHEFEFDKIIELTQT
ncbi:PAS domain S-box protein [Microseira wollei]|uniref:Circadian input-output histidine kinase CikA n=1 Tax=Microseira wollei NIES-4236 TaxID=2530354 RepID=A0AAV3XRA2_9CYAN|nr:PAS domain S-box protein [Microseira wollei]GET43117.1 multi-sensor hybrid histidine kinase [Microseira wollei NIES-4236]